MFKGYQIARAREASHISRSWEYKSADLPQIVREKRDYLSIMYMQKLDSVFLLVLFISCHVLLVRPLAFVLLAK